MVWYNLRVGSFNLKYTPIKPLSKEFESVNSEGKPLKKVIESKSISYFVDEQGTKYDSSRVFKMINRKPMAKLSKTKETDIYKEVDGKEVEDLLIEKEYVVMCEPLYNELKSSGKALKIGFTNGNGFKVFKAYIHTSNLYEGILFMSLGTTQKSEVIQDILAEQKTKIKEVDLVVNGIDRAKVEDLIEL